MNDLKKEQSYKSMFMFGMFSIVMFFAGLTSYFLVYQGFADLKYKSIDIPLMFLFSTIVIIISSIFLIFSISKFKKEEIKSSENFLFFTIVLGFVFFLFQFFAWKKLISNGHYPTGTGTESSYLFLLTAVHLVHIIFGLFFLIQSYLKMNSNFFSKETLIAIRLKYWFWHFLGFLWIFLYSFLLIVI